MNTARLDFATVATAALGASEAVLARWLPNGKRRGSEWVARNPRRADERAGSFSINTHTGAWCDFATGDRGGDLVALVAYLEGVTQAEAARRLAEFLQRDPFSAVPAVPRSRSLKKTSNNNGLHAVEAGTAPRTAAGPAVPARSPGAEDWQPLLPVPVDATPAPAKHPRKGAPSARWEYRDADGRLLFHVCRFERPDGGKEVQPLSYGRLGDRTGWYWKALPAPRPLYGLDRLAARPDAPVLVCEGEKAADAAAMLFPGYVAVTSPNGSNSAGKADWRSLSGRRCVIWPDADAPGTAYAEAVERLTEAADARCVQLLDLREMRRTPATDADGRPTFEAWEAGRELAEGWDAADAIAEGWTAEHLAELQRQLQILEGCLFVPTPAAVTAALAEAAAQFRAADTAEPFRPHFELLTEWREDANGRKHGPGVYWHGCDRQGEPLAPEWISEPLSVIAYTRDNRGESWGRLLAFEDRERRRHEWAMPMELLRGDGAELRGELLRRGLIFATAPRARQRLADYIAQERPEAFARCVDRTGWHGTAFVLPDRTLGEAEERVLFQAETTAEHAFAESGTLDEWCAHVAALCVGNSRLMFAVSAGFAALLLGRVGEESGGIHFRGGSSTGKTTALQAAASVFGPPGRYVQRWRATANGLEAIAVQHADCLLILDELAQVDPKDAGEAAYLLANGQGKARAGRSGGARVRASWRLLFLSAGEISLTEHMRAAGKRAHAGQEIRLADLDADAGKGFGIFEHLHGRADGAALARELAEAAGRYHGTAGPAFIAALLPDLAALPGIVETLRSKWLAKHLPADASGQAHRVASRFALVGVAGEIATAYGVTGWPKGAALDAAAACLRAWFDGRSGAGNREPVAMLNQVRRFLLAHGESRFADLDGSDERRAVLNRVGFRKREGAGWRYFIPAEGWSEVCTGFDPKAVAALLAARGCLDTEGGRTTRRERLPELGRCRVYVVTPALWEDTDDAAT